MSSPFGGSPRFRGDRGAGVVEYGLLLGIFLIAVVGTLKWVQGQGTSALDRQSGNLDYAVNDTGAPASKGSTSTSTSSSTTTTSSTSTTTTSTTALPASTTTTAAPTTTTTTAATPKVWVGAGSTVKWSNYHPNGGGAWQADVKIANAYGAAGQNGQFTLTTVKVNSDGSRTTSTRSWQLSSANPITVTVDNLDFRNSKNQQVVAIEVSVTAVQLQNQQSTAVANPPVVRIDMPAIP